MQAQSKERKLKTFNNFMNIEEASPIVKAYGPLLEDSVGVVAIDEKFLPFPKNDIKRALKTSILYANNPKLFQALYEGYISLSTWQPGVGDIPIGAKLRDVTFNSPKIEIDETATSISEGAKQQLDEAFQNFTDAKDEIGPKWREIATKEEQDLKVELAPVLMARKQFQKHFGHQIKTTP